MAKKKAESGPGTFMILVLVFFILSTLILGVTTYLGFDGQAELEAKAKEAADKQKAAEAQAAEQLLRRNVDRVILGIETPENRQELAGAPQGLVATIVDEIRLAKEKLGAAGALPGQRPFDIPAGGGEGAPPVTPTKTVPQIAKEWYRIAQDYKSKFEAEERARKTADMKAQAEQAQKEADKKAFDASVDALNKQMAAKIQAMDDAFKKLKADADLAGINFKKTEDQWAEDKAKLDELAQVLKNEIKNLKDRLVQAENPDPSDIEARWKHMNPARMAESMGTITAKSDQFVTIQFGKRLVLIPGQTFVVVPANRSLAEVLEREKALEKRHHERVSLGARDPFADNELIKGTVEVTEVVGPDTARARITYQSQEIRNPISKGDGVFNMSLSSGAKEHVAVAGIIDLDGDGRPDLDQFIRLLERNNLVVDSYLDLRTGEIKGKGIDTGTKFLILGQDAPMIGNLKKMVDKAGRTGTQLIDSRVFMTLIGMKPPRNAAPPVYASVNLGTDNAPAAPKQ